MKKELAISPFDYCVQNELGIAEYEIVKIITHWNDELGGVARLDEVVELCQGLQRTLRPKVFKKKNQDDVEALVRAKMEREPSWDRCGRCGNSHVPGLPCPSND
jgi:hypothetical protein